MTTCAETYLPGLSIMADWLCPEEVIKRNCHKCSEFYQNHPVMSRLIFVPLATMSGIVKVFLFPVIAAIGALVLPIIAAIKALRGQKGAEGYLQAGVFCLFGVALVGSFLIVSAFYIPVVASSGLFMAAIVISIAVHIHYASHSPQIIEDLPAKK